MRQECATLEEAEVLVNTLQAEKKYVVSAIQRDGFIEVQWLEHKKYTAMDGQEFYDELWLTKEGKMMLIQDIELEHCRNIIRMILRQEREAEASLKTLTETLSATLGTLQTEMEQMAELDENAVTSTEPARVLH
jgi:hypothetical protein